MTDLKKEKCTRCGKCCECLPNWNDMNNLERAFIRLYDKEAEQTFIRVVDGICPNLSKNGRTASCKIYNKRHNFCKAFHCNTGIGDF